ncbi:MAG: hypothetical protein F6K58_11945, partial [Symploca sp. SIO2E9]|nr:hypothetical protein [Symploca sp. SIO2E9]
TATNLEVTNGAQLIASTFGRGDAGNVILEISQTAFFDGINPLTGINPSGLFSSVEQDGEGKGGNVELTATNLEVTNGATLTASTFGRGDAGNVILEISEIAHFDGVNLVTGINPSGAGSNVGQGGEGKGGNVKLTVANLEVTNGAQLSASSFGTGDAGNLSIRASELVEIDGGSATDTGLFTQVGGRVGGSGEGKVGNLIIDTERLVLRNGGQINATIFGISRGSESRLTVRASEIQLIGTTTIPGRTGIQPSAIQTRIEPRGSGEGTDLIIETERLSLEGGARIAADIEQGGRGQAGNIFIQARDSVKVIGIAENRTLPSLLTSSINEGATGNAGDLTIETRRLLVQDGARILATTSGVGDAGNVILDISETARLEGTNPINSDPSGVFSSIEPSGEGQGGDVQITADNLEVLNGASLSAGSRGQGNAGNVVLNIRDRIQARDGTIATNAEFNAGGQIQIAAGTIFLFDDSDIQTFVNSGAEDGGNITITANALVALDDSDILAFSVDGRGGAIDLSQTTLFSQNLNLTSENLSREELFALDGNNRVDINATGGTESGQVSINDASFIENNIAELSDNLVNPETLVANSCIIRSDETTGTLTVTGGDSLPQQPDSPEVTYSLGTVQTIPDTEQVSTNNTIIEPQGVYRLANGRLVMSRECDR